MCMFYVRTCLAPDVSGHLQILWYFLAYLLCCCEWLPRLTNIAYVVVCSVISMLCWLCGIYIDSMLCFPLFLCLAKNALYWSTLTSKHQNFMLNYLPEVANEGLVARRCSRWYSWQGIDKLWKVFGRNELKVKPASAAAFLAVIIQWCLEGIV